MQIHKDTEGAMNELLLICITDYRLMKPDFGAHALLLLIASSLTQQNQS